MALGNVVDHELTSLRRFEESRCHYVNDRVMEFRGLLRTEELLGFGAPTVALEKLVILTLSLRIFCSTVRSIETERDSVN